MNLQGWAEGPITREPFSHLWSHSVLMCALALTGADYQTDPITGKTPPFTALCTLRHYKGWFQQNKANYEHVTSQGNKVFQMPPVISHGATEEKTAESHSFDAILAQLPVWGNGMPTEDNIKARALCGSH